jgi:hypothetical protein
MTDVKKLDGVLSLAKSLKSIEKPAFWISLYSKPRATSLVAFHPPFLFKPLRISADSGYPE